MSGRPQLLALAAVAVAAASLGGVARATADQPVRLSVGSDSFPDFTIKQVESFPGLP